MTLCPGEAATATVAYYNSGSRGWVLGRPGETAYLGTSNPSPGQDQPSVLGGDGINGSPATGWPVYNRLAVQPGAYVAPGQVAWFQFNVRAPLAPGRYSIALRPLIEGTQWMEDYGVFWNVVVLNPDGTQPPITVGGINFRIAASARADVYVEASITNADAVRLAGAVDQDVARIEANFGRSFNRRPVLYAFGSELSANVGNLTIAHMNTEDAIFFAKAEGGFFDPTVGSIFLNWFQFASVVPLTTARHELTHMLINQLSGPAANIPAWFNEGNARLEEFGVPQSGWFASLNHYTAASAAVASPSALIPLAELVSQDAWNRRPAPLSTFEYYEASEAARFVRQDVGLAGTVTILELMRLGQSFEVAFQTVTGTSASTFTIAFPARLKATIAAYPAVALTNDTPVGAGVSYTAYGFGPSRSLTVTFTANGFSGADTRVTDSFGAAHGYAALASGWPLGTYAITVSDGTSTVTTTIVLTGAGSGVP